MVLWGRGKNRLLYTRACFSKKTKNTNLSKAHFLVPGEHGQNQPEAVHFEQCVSNASFSDFFVTITRMNRLFSSISLSSFVSKKVKRKTEKNSYRKHRKIEKWLINMSG